MNFLDMKTVIFSHIVTDIVCLLVMLFLWQRNRSRFAGLSFWVADYAMQVAAVVLIMLRDVIPDAISMVGGGSLAIAGLLAMLLGLQRLFNQKATQIHNYILMAVFIVVLSYFALVQPNLAARNLNLSAAILILSFQCMWFLLRGVPPDLRPLTQGAGMVFAGYSAVSGTRVVLILTGPISDSHFFSSGTFDTLIILSYQMLFIIQTYSLVLLINRLLLKDVREREDKLSENERYFRTLIYTLHEDILVIDRNYRITDINNTALQALGKTREEVIGKDCFVISHGFNAPCNEKGEGCPLIEVFNTGRVCSCQHIHIREIGTRVHVDILMSPIKDADGRVTHVVEASRDITDLISALEEKQSSQQHYRVTLMSVGDAVITTDSQGRVEVLNPVAEALTGWTCEEASGRTLDEIFQIVNEYTGEPVQSPLELVLREGKVVGLANHTLLIARDGSRRPIADSGAPIRNDKGEIEGVVMVFRDQTEERLAYRLTQTRLSLISYASSHSRDELITKVLDEAGGFVESPIGFYHFVEPDQKTLSLQHWSARTLNEFCTTESKAMHYGIDQAGVWTDCIHHKRPVIHNDYASIPHKKGIPEGHPQVIREMVVPVMREGKIMAILGVGNKPTDYTEKDVEIISYLADVAWELVSQKRAFEALQESEDRFKHVFQYSAIGKSITLLSGEIQANDAFYRMLGYSEAESRSIKWQEITHPDDIETSQRIINSLLSGEKASEQFTKRYIHKNGSVVWAEVSVVLRRDKEGNPVYFMTTINDITQRKHAEKELEERESMLQTILRASPIGMGLVIDRVFKFVNDSMCRLIGYSREELIGKSARIIYPSQEEFDRVGRVKHGQIREQGVGAIETQLRHKDGSIIDVIASSAAIDPSNPSAGVIFTMTDITERKTAETERANLQDQLVQAQKMESVGRLAGGVAHDFNNMLGVILGRTELILIGMKPEDRRYTDLTEIQKAANRSADLTRQLLAFARKQTIAPKVLDLNEVVEGMLKMIRRLIGEDIDLIWKPDADLWPVKMDPAQIDQILANLCVNSRDAIKGTGKVTIETENVVIDNAYCMDHTGCMPGRYIMLAVSDNGCGMEKEILSHLFEPFFTTKEIGRGTGLGLATVYGIVKQNGGFINVYSESGYGTAFKIYIPRFEGAAPKEVEFKLPEIVQGKREQILLVEDDPAILVMGKVMLEKLGYVVIGVESPGDAIKQAKEYPDPIHLLITDVVMPQMSGKDLARKIKEIQPEIKILFMSGYTANVIAHHGVLDEGVNFIQKPFSMATLSTRIKEALG
ncbi:MAG: PAS domain S-box protein [Thermodesulfobacteriota bacterium]